MDISWGVAVAILVPLVGGLLLGGKIIRQVEENEEVLIRQEQHIEALDGKVGLLEQRAAVLAVLLQMGQGHPNVVESVPR